VQAAGRDFNDHLSFGIETIDNRFVPGISVWRIKPLRHDMPDRPSRKDIKSPPGLPNEEIGGGPPGETTFEQFTRVRALLEPLPEFAWGNDHFDLYNVFQTKVPFGNGARVYFLAPKSPAELQLGNMPQQIAFSTPLAVPLSDRNVVEDGPTFVASLRYSESVGVFRLFYPRITPSSRWLSEAASTAKFVTNRLLPTSQSK
jgi:hypothetical protein